MRVPHRPPGPVTWLGQATQNVELGNYTSALYEARELAMTRMQDETRGTGAQGIVAMRIEQASHIWGSHVIEFLAIGTTVAVAGRAISGSTPPWCCPSTMRRSP